MLKRQRLNRVMSLVASGCILLQVGSCTTDRFLNLVQTVFLGVTAAGAVAILQNL